jgi:hypothetical protein
MVDSLKDRQYFLKECDEFYLNQTWIAQDSWGWIQGDIELEPDRPVGPENRSFIDSFQVLIMPVSGPLIIA